MVVVIAIGVLGVLVAQLARNRTALDVARTDAQILAEARSALLGYAVSMGSSNLPGQLPSPDLNLNGAGYGVGGGPNCLNATGGTTASGAGMRCLGLLPWKTLGLAGYADSYDASGRVPWYAVSANLIDLTCLDGVPLNPGIAQVPVQAGSCGLSGRLPHPWLSVYDRSGRLLSDKVAAVILLPGPVVGNQTRPTQATVTTTLVGRYLEGRNAVLDDAFEQGAPDAGFNDRLVYITVDELMAMAQKRALEAAKRFLVGYYTASAISPTGRHFPYATTLTDATRSVSGLRLGGLPAPVGSCTCNRNGCTCTVTQGAAAFDFAGIAGASFSGANGACRVVGNACVCDGSTSGSCTTNSRQIHIAAGQIVGTSTAPASCGTSRAVENICNCTTNGAVAARQCSIGLGNYSFTTNGPIHTPWFTDQRWQDYILYSVASGCTAGTPGCTSGFIQLGSTNVHALLIGAGPPVANVVCGSAPYTQSGVRPSANLCDYLDTAVNTTGKMPLTLDRYDAAQQVAQTPNANDYPVIVAP
jgi:hypothetical protein